RLDIPTVEARIVKEQRAQVGPTRSGIGRRGEDLVQDSATVRLLRNVREDNSLRLAPGDRRVKVGVLLLNQRREFVNVETRAQSVLDSPPVRPAELQEPHIGPPEPFPNRSIAGG